MRRLQRRLPAGRPSVCAWMLWLLCAACAAPSHGEWDPRQCSDGLDNDADGRIDCDDPDCWAFVCGARLLDAGPPPLAGVGAGGSSAGADAAAVGHAGMDAHVNPPEPDDAGMESDVDAGASTPPPECSPLRDDCGSGRECVSGQCRPVDITGRYTLSILSAVVPSRPSITTCYDPDVWCSLGPCDGSCQPDPYVVVTKNSVVRVGSSPAQMDTTKPSWTKAQLEIELRAGDSLLFGAWDADTFGNAEIFTCSPQLQAQLRSGTLRCSPSTRSDGNYEIVVGVSPR